MAGRELNQLSWTKNGLAGLERIANISGFHDCYGGDAGGGTVVTSCDVPSASKWESTWKILTPLAGLTSMANVQFPNKAVLL